MVITVFGLGFVGLTTALGFSELGHAVYGIELNEERKQTIKDGKLPFLEPGLDVALARHLNKNFQLCEDLKQAISESDCIYYCVGTPYGENGEADLTYLYTAVEDTLQHCVDDKFRVLVTKSTIPPSTTKEKIIPFVENHGFHVGENIGVANNPEFLREGYCWDDFIHSDRIVLGVSDEKSEGILKKIYVTMNVPVHCVSLNTGEFIKYLSNTLLATLISYSNEMSIAAHTIGGIDVSTAFRILHEDKRWGGCNMTSYVYPGCGYGGYCLPKDTNAMYAVTKTAGYEAKILGNVISVNDSMVDFMVKRITEACQADKSKTIGILGLSFKPGSDDVRDAPSGKIISKLNDLGYQNILAYAPVAMNEFQKYYHSTYRCVESFSHCTTESEILVIATAWQEFSSLKGNSEKKVIDCRYML